MPLHALQLPPTLLAAQGWTSVQVVEGPAVRVVAPLFAALRREPCGHSWREPVLTCETAVEQLRAVRAAEQRPTRIFAYVAHGTDGTPTPVACAALSMRVRADFRHDGFPVCARAFVHPEHRGLGLYAHLLSHRLAACHASLGPRLRAIHLGASDPLVERVVAAHQGDLHFVKVGEERLEIAGNVYTVPDYLAAAPAFLADLAVQAPSLHAFLAEGEGDWAQLRPGLAGHAARDVRAFVELMDAIGVMP